MGKVYEFLMKGFQPGAGSTCEDTDECWAQEWTSCVQFQFCETSKFCDISDIQLKTDHCALNAKCTNIQGDHLCECLPGFRPNSTAVQPDTCDDIDECKEFSPCDARKSFKSSQMGRTTDTVRISLELSDEILKTIKCILL